MDPTRFDVLARALSETHSRRGALLPAIGVTLAFVGARGSTAKKKKRCKGPCDYASCLTYIEDLLMPPQTTDKYQSWCCDRLQGLYTGTKFRNQVFACLRGD